MTYPSPRYFADHGTVTAIYRPGTQAHDLEIGTNTKVGFLATGASTDGLFGLYRWDMGPALKSGAGEHYHTTFAESFYILDGTIGLYNGETWVDARPGDFFYVPPGGIHGFRNDSGQPASMLILFTPGAPREGYFQELAEIVASGRQLSDDEWADVYRRHDQYMV